MDLIDPENEFMPIDDDKAEFLIRLAEDVRRIGLNGSVSEHEGEILGVAANNMLILICQAMGGFDLFASWRDHAMAVFTEATMMRFLLDRIKDDLRTAELGLTYEALENFKDYLEENFEEDYQHAKYVENRINVALNSERK